MLKKKTDSLFSKRISDFWGLITIILALGSFFTGKTDIHSFFQDITITNFLFTLLKTLSAYILTILVITFSFFIILDFILLIFGFSFPVATFLWSTIFHNVVVEWWWQESLSQNIFLSVVLLYFLSSYEIVIKGRTYSLIYKRVGTRLHSFSLGVFSQTFTKTDGLHIGFIIIQNSPEESKNDEV